MKIITLKRVIAVVAVVMSLTAAAVGGVWLVQEASAQLLTGPGPGGCCV